MAFHHSRIPLWYLTAVNITSMAVRRSRVIVNLYASEMHHMSIYIWISLLWLLSFLSTLPAMVFVDVTPNGMCYDTWPSLQVKKAFRLFKLVVQHLLPLYIIAVAYVRIALSLSRSKDRKHSKQPRALSKARRRENNQVVRTIASIVIIFAVSMFPRPLAALYYYFGKKSPSNARILFRMFIISEIFAVRILHSFLNPVVYDTVMKHFRAGYVKYLKAFCCRWYTRAAQLTRLHRSSSCARLTPPRFRLYQN